MRVSSLYAGTTTETPGVISAAVISRRVPFSRMCRWNPPAASTTSTR